MFLENQKPILITLIALFFAQISFAQEEQEKSDQQVVSEGINILRNYFLEDNNWYVVQSANKSDVSGLVNFLEDAPIDNILRNLSESKQNDSIFVTRLPENVEDSLSVPGYVSAPVVLNNIDQISIQYQNEVAKNPISVPEYIVTNAKAQVSVIPKGEGMTLFTNSVYIMPDSLLIPEVIPDSVLNTPEEFNKLVRIDSIRNNFIEQRRQFYNDSITDVYVTKVMADYRKQKFEEQLDFRIKQYNDLVKVNNYQVLVHYNDSVIGSVNESIRAAMEVLTSYADYVDTAKVTITNLTGESEEILLQNGRERYSRVWLKNEQKDSLRVMVKTTDKRGMQMLIDDGVTFSRIKEKQTKDFDFESLKGDYSKFSDVGKSYELETPWKLGGDGSVGFTQTYLENWKKGGQSALSLLMVLKGSANYTSADKKVKWENSAEIRNGWIRPGGDDAELQKNSDKFELTSRYGLSAFKKWYYSAEFNLNTQFFRGYTYPKEDNPTPYSAFMAPLKTYFKVGLDYKPNNKFSLLLSPLTLKNVYVRDTSLIDQTNYGIDEDQKTFWEPGLNADLTYKHQLANNITWETKYNMFINYGSPFSKFDIDWENNFKVQLNSYMSMQMMFHMIYDDDVMFSVYDDDGNEIGEKAKLQFKEFITIGFSYTINRDVQRTKRIR